MRRLPLVALTSLCVALPSSLPLGAQPRGLQVPVITPRGLAQLRWIEGDWRGAGMGGTQQAPFYERYRFVDDSTLTVESFADSTFRTVRDAARYELRGGRLGNVGMGPRYVAVRLDSLGVEFAPVSRASNHFRWDRAKGAGMHPAQWQAMILWVETTAMRRREYVMRRVR
ncbi:hypothetical protein J421_5986 (plasmid) [Gemmatirosa kalamazoonensis]|uniref:DUF1579 domain-containing protein n=1 Tax=Gemmatirosa kalamazoonensis TaxID=861299 RepID=W0RS40_9BACT|nr:hypothetical protein [Gemmatirosa kalamazoonensis]AHG93521.1 hypothetical protein J421_5986 [Gemmatirosa kalamazoonensis]